MDKLLILLAWVAGILVVLVLGRKLKIPLQFALKLLLNGLLGGVVILLINFFGQYIGFYISLNVFSALIAGVLGLPGVIVLVILKYLL
ncbi:MAG: pro-sigmaK processing inhibitor BofA family protein [Thermoclostridium sp.]|nr:pro-sigmaK processing inhibitor BofA family protein [Thermoclostridium sp.]